MDFTACQGKCEAIDTRHWGVLDEPCLSFPTRRGKQRIKQRITQNSELRHPFLDTELATLRRMTR